MAVESGNLPPEYLHFFLVLLGTACSLFFGLVSWLVRVALKRAVAQALALDDGFKELSREHRQFKHRVTMALALAGITDADGNPTGKRIGH